jgi:hypothetical protein
VGDEQRLAVQRAAAGNAYTVLVLPSGLAKSTLAKVDLGRLGWMCLMRFLRQHLSVHRTPCAEQLERT